MGEGAMKKMLQRYGSDSRQYVGDVGLVEGRERETLFAEVVEGRTDVNECRFVDDEEAVMELVGGLDRERVGVLRVEL